MFLTKDPLCELTVPIMYKYFYAIYIPFHDVSAKIPRLYVRQTSFSRQYFVLKFIHNYQD